MGVLREKNKSFERTSHVMKKIFFFWKKQGQKRDKNSNFQLFLAHLLASLVLANWLYFHLLIKTSSLMVGLAIGRVMSISGEVNVGFSRWSL